MKEFFRGWRRKIGCVTLGKALMAMGAWIRSQKYIESGLIRLNEDRLLAGCSNQGSFRLITFQNVGTTPSDDEFPIGTVKWKRATVISNEWQFTGNPDEIFVPLFFGLSVEWHSDRRLHGFRFAEATVSDGSSKAKCSAWKIPYWSIVIPLTVLSAFLLLSKPRPRKPKSPPEPIQETSVNHV